MIKHLYANGCSMTEGCELGNNKFGFDEKAHYCGPYTNRKFLEDIKKPNKNHDPVNHRKYMAENSWPNRLRAKLGIESYTNDGYSGASNFRIVRTTMASVNELLKTYQAEELLVVIGWSGFSRYELFYENAWWTLSPTFSKIDIPNKDLAKMCELYNKWIIPELRYLVSTHLMHVNQMKDFLESRNIKYVFSYGIAEAMNLNYSMDERWELENNKEIRSLYELSGFGKNWVFNDPLGEFGEAPSYETFIEKMTHKAFFDFAKDKNFKFGSGLHPLETAHDAWAQHLRNHVITKGLMQ